MAEASFFTQTEPLITAFSQELARFSGGGTCAFYRREDEGEFLKVGGGLDGAPERIAADDAAVVRLRAERKRVDLGETRSSLPGAMAFPMVHRAEVFGVLLLAAKPSGDDYRPDEAEILGWAVNQIGHDLHALRVERLEKRVATLDSQLEFAVKAGLARPGPA